MTSAIRASTAHTPPSPRRATLAVLACLGLAGLLPGAAPQALAQAAAPEEAAPTSAMSPPLPATAALCEAPWFRSGSRVQMEGDGELPMSITMTLRDVMRTARGCSAQLEVRSKSALAALMGPPVVMDQVHEINIDRNAATMRTRIDSRNAVINARGRYARMFGEASFTGSGVFNYAGQEIKEGVMLDGETFQSSVSLKVYPLGADEVVGTLEAQRASIIVGSRHVGRKQMLNTVMGRKECMPITYEKRTSLGPLRVGDEILHVEPSVLHVTDWYCPAEAFVLRTEIRQNNKVQRVDVTALEMEGPAQ
ncbi:hypothetical protein [Cupriavidus agavae]|uniref:DUF3108 domain-containing protein n=1 Tax=Cupriavidus agavae TaxID=1001822 RepID=A0A4Q7RHT0_9BURK|nr:hypothetical protein [Cupriavidus agavae]RZT31412.1 hypothetical protein EV147_4593 [Cupriavidus agavae]